MLPIKLLVRTACCLNANFQSRHTKDEGLFLRSLEGEYQGLQSALDRLVKARCHGLELVVPTLQADLIARIQDVKRVLENWRQYLQKPVPTLPTIPELVAELRQLEEEFGGVQIHSKQKAISVTTEPITLEDVYLGPFVIKLFWNRSANELGSDCFAIIAREPNPPADHESVTHPHVKDESLCAGDAAPAIRKALAERRIADAFCLVRSVLGTYNPASPHVALDAWNGLECYDCGTSISSDESWTCDSCQNDLCSDCIQHCQSCDTCRCASCIPTCSVCDQSVCEGCRWKSAHSSRDCCCRCLISCLRCRHLVARDESNQGCPALPATINQPSPLENSDETCELAGTAMS